MIAAIVPAAGAGLRMDADLPKQFLTLGGRPLVVRTLQELSRSSLIEEVVLVVPADWVAKALTDLVEHYGLEKVVSVVAGGARRQDSVACGLEALSADTDVVVVHDGVRPFVTSQMVRDVIEAAREAGAAVTAHPASDTIKREAGGQVVETIERRGLICVQTPQAFRTEVLREALDKSEADQVEGTDEAALVERLGRPVRVVAGSSFNLKVTTPEDWALAEQVALALDRSAAPGSKAEGRP